MSSVSLAQTEECILHVLLSARGPLPTSAIKKKCNIKSQGSTREWLRRLKKRGFVVPVGYIQESNYYESLWAITEVGAGFLVYFLTKKAEEEGKSLMKSMRSCRGSCGLGELEGVRFYVQRVYVDGGGVFGERSIVELLRHSKGVTSAEVGVKLVFPKRLPRMWFQIYSKGRELRVESRVRVREVYDSEGFGWVNVREWYGWVKRLKDVVDMVYSLLHGYKNK